MNFRPVNGYILVERDQEESEAPLILIPTEYSPRGENFVKLKVISIRADNPLSLYSGSYILTRESMDSIREPPNIAFQNAPKSIDSIWEAAAKRVKMSSF